jgi:BlaI family penicillinase repressor
MKRARIHRLGELQLRILRALWQREGRRGTVAQVIEGLGPDADLAYTTVATMLRKMEDRGLVKHQADGRAFVYRAMVDEEEVTRGMADHFVDRLFEGSLADLVAHFLRHRDVSPEELQRLERLIKERKKQA